MWCAKYIVAKNSDDVKQNKAKRKAKEHELAEEEKKLSGLDKEIKKIPSDCYLDFIVEKVKDSNNEAVPSIKRSDLVKRKEQYVVCLCSESKAKSK